MEYPKSDSIDNGHISLQSETAANLLIDQDILNDDPLASGVEPVASGPDLAALGQDKLAEFATRARDTSRALQARGLDFAREAKVKAERNPWFAIAAASASALAVGLIVGRLMKKPAVEIPSEEYPSGYDE